VDKKVIILPVLVLVLIGGWVFALKGSGPKSVSLSQDFHQEIEEQQKLSQDLTLALKEIKERKRIGSLSLKKIKRNPFNPPLKLKRILKEKEFPPFNLSAIVFDEKPVAIINGKIVKENSFIGGTKVVRIEKKTVSLDTGAGKIILKLGEE